MNPHVISWMQIDTGNPGYDPDDPQFQRRYLAEGDSWFSLRGIPTSNLPTSLDLPQSTIVVSCAQPGDTIRSMGDMIRNEGVKRMTDRKLGHRWDAILLSGGGNDLLDNAKHIIKPLPAGQTAADPAAYCDQAVLDQTLDGITRGYTRIVAWRDRKASSCPGCPIVTHTYDWATPRDAPARFFGLKLKGPWLYKALTHAQVPEAMWIPVSDHLIGALGDAIRTLAASLGNFNVVDTRNTLARAEPGSTVTSNDWADEIHPTQSGYTKLAGKIGRALP